MAPGLHRVIWHTSYYRTGEKRDPLSFWRQDTPLVEPRAIPIFAPARMILRSSGVVI
jgi:hypothetical protein